MMEFRLELISGLLEMYTPFWGWVMWCSLNDTDLQRLFLRQQEAAPPQAPEEEEDAVPELRSYELAAAAPTVLIASKASKRSKAPTARVCV